MIENVIRQPDKPQTPLAKSQCDACGNKCKVKNRKGICMQCTANLKEDSK